MTDSAKNKWYWSLVICMIVIVCFSWLQYFQAHKLINLEKKEQKVQQEKIQKAQEAQKIIQDYQGDGLVDTTAAKNNGDQFFKSMFDLLQNPSAKPHSNYATDAVTQSFGGALNVADPDGKAVDIKYVRQDLAYTTDITGESNAFGKVYYTVNGDEKSVDVMIKLSGNQVNSIEIGQVKDTTGGAKS